jgi:hypothetical protein
LSEAAPVVADPEAVRGTVIDVLDATVTVPAVTPVGRPPIETNPLLNLVPVNV